MAVVTAVRVVQAAVQLAQLVVLAAALADHKQPAVTLVQLNQVFLASNMQVVGPAFQQRMIRRPPKAEVAAVVTTVAVQRETTAVVAVAQAISQI